MHTLAVYQYRQDITLALEDSLVSNILLAASCLLITNNMQYYLPRHEKYWYVLIISLGLSGCCLLLSKYLLFWLTGIHSDYALFLRQSTGLRFALDFLMIGCMAMFSLLWYTQQEQAQTAKRQSDAERLAREAELFKLRQQLQPHFLFNSLNSISALTGAQPEKARHMIQQLSDFLRGTLRKEEHAWVSLQEELDHLQLYLEIEKVRFGHRLQTSIQCSETACSQRLPALLLQPVVENAIKFGLYDTTEAVVISLEAIVQHKQLLITISNPFDPDTAAASTGTGFGLSSIQRRLFLLFARTDLLQTSAIGNHFITTLTIPQPA
ncbi:sensor histidine kinase [Deminuibacter soli]|uniref:Sensor histidine kinase n=1 Tax=Deminuibacter soli TaxID=2291815 RepID=A0A3E1NDF2_9BACT|nr:sensor histidine kinase [Deminuibacter soli]